MPVKETKETVAPEPTPEPMPTEREATERETKDAVAADPHSHGPSSPDQASAAAVEVADAMAFRGVETAYAPDNEIEAGTRRMANAGASAGEIAAWRAEQLGKLGE